MWEETHYFFAEVAIDTDVLTDLQRIYVKSTNKTALQWTAFVWDIKGIPDFKFCPSVLEVKELIKTDKDLFIEVIEKIRTYFLKQSPLAVSSRQQTEQSLLCQIWLIFETIGFFVFSGYENYFNDRVTDIISPAKIGNFSLLLQPDINQTAGLIGIGEALHYDINLLQGMNAERSIISFNRGELQDKLALVNVAVGKAVGVATLDSLMILVKQDFVFEAHTRFMVEQILVLRRTNCAGQEYSSNDDCDDIREILLNKIDRARTSKLSPEIVQEKIENLFTGIVSIYEFCAYNKIQLLLLGKRIQGDIEKIKANKGLSDTQKNKFEKELQEIAQRLYGPSPQQQTNTQGPTMGASTQSYRH
jgi:hypothetical protein